MTSETPIIFQEKAQECIKSLKPYFQRKDVNIECFEKTARSIDTEDQLHGLLIGLSKRIEAIMIEFWETIRPENFEDAIQKEITLINNEFGSIRNEKARDIINTVKRALENSINKFKTQVQVFETSDLPLDPMRYPDGGIII